ncbi:carbohydrate ABC transporter permease [Streptomyces sp. NPDC051985]|uniref:carbohydrate ABC transporter permease n=1 Tax=Streptomyces sp. NPDC051985 TaxID=3155807 RepID=UPI00343F372B
MSASVMSTRAERLTGTVVLWAFAAAVLVPFAAIALAALHPAGAPVAGLSWPSTPHFENFRRAWTIAGFGSLLRSSATIALVVVPIGALFATMAGYAFGTMRFTGSRLLFSFLLIGLTLPPEAAVIPLYYDLKQVGLTDSYWALILPLIGLYMPFGAFWMRAHFLSVPRELAEAARVDGASEWAVFRRVMIPTARPAIATLAMLFFVWSWNQFLLALILIQEPSRRTAPAGLGFFIDQNTRDVPMLCAATLIVIAPVIALYLIGQRHLIRGMTQGAVKG